MPSPSSPASLLERASAVHDGGAQVSCATCPSTNNCCNTLDRIWLTHREYDALFAAHEADLVVQRRDHFVIIDHVKSGPCPHWTGGGCGVYDRRPVECRLFPHTLSHVETTPTGVDVHLHAATECPAAERLTHPAETAADMCRAMIADTALAGREVRIHVHGVHAASARIVTLAQRGWRRLLEPGRVRAA